MSNEPTPVNGGEIPHQYPFTLSIFLRLKDLREVEHKRLIGELLTYMESLFDPGQRCEAVKSNIRNIIFDWRGMVEQNTRDFAYDVARSCGDTILCEALKHEFRAHGLYPSLPRFTEFVGENVEAGSKE